MKVQLIELSKSELIELVEFKNKQINEKNNYIEAVDNTITALRNLSKSRAKHLNGKEK